VPVFFLPFSRRPSGPAELAARAARGDREAFGELFERYASMVHGILLAHVPQAEADDLMQEVFLSALERVDRLQQAEAVGGWFAAIARNRVVDYLRTRKETVELPPTLSVVDPRRAEVNEVLERIRTLPEAYREPLILRLVEGMTAAEIAEQCGLKAESVRVNLHRGMQKLREALGVEVKHGA
jgi:RNA polymerase sigma-70 factor, ECF subfamily